MKDWDYAQWVSYIALAIGAIILAMDQSIRLAPDVSKKFGWLIDGNVWAFAPVTLVILATIILGLRDLGFLKQKFPPSVDDKIHFIKFEDPYRPIVVVGKIFTNEKVVLDGYSYSNCTFENVTFVFNGMTPVTMINSKIGGLITLKTDNPSVNVKWLVAGMFRDAPGPRKVTVPSGSVFEPIKRGD
jgi:hypothetical protein